MSELSKTALEAAARVVWSAYADSPLDAEGMPGEPTDWREYGDIPEVMQARCRSYARSALYAYLTQLSAEGYGVVPKYPTDAMIEAGNMEAWPVAHGDRADAEAIYRAMFDAAQECKP